MISPRRSAAPSPVELAFALGMARCMQDLPVWPPVVIAGVSGGLDSVCLTHLLARFLPPRGVQQHIAHFDHALRPSSAEDAAFVAALAQQLDLPCHTRRSPPGDRRGLGLEAEARRARYQFLGEIACAITQQPDTPVVIVAHHADDQAETVLLNLARGAGRRGLTGMEPLSRLPEQPEERPVLLLRPLLALRRAELLHYAEEGRLEWREDETNAVADRPRTLIRHVVLPAVERINPFFVPNLARVLQAARSEEQRMASIVMAAYRLALVGEVPGRRIVLRSDVLSSLDAEIRVALLREILLRHFSDAMAKGMPWLVSLAEHLSRPLCAGGPNPIAGGVAWTSIGATPAAPARISLHRAKLLPEAPQTPWLDKGWRTTHAAQQVTAPGAFELGDFDGWALEARLLAPPVDVAPESPWEVKLDAGRCGEPILTAPQPGMRIAPLGMEGHTRSLGDIFTDHKVPAALRPGWPVIVDRLSGRILWLCGLVVGEAARVDAQTATVLWLRWVRREQP